MYIYEACPTLESNEQYRMLSVDYNDEQKEPEATIPDSQRKRTWKTKPFFVYPNDYKNVCSLLAITSSCCSRVRSINFTA